MTTTTKRAAAILNWLKVRPAPPGQASIDPAHVAVDPVAARAAEAERSAIAAGSRALRTWPGQHGVDIALGILHDHLDEAGEHA